MNIIKEIDDNLSLLAEENVKKFSEKIITTKYKIYGIRLSKLRNYAKKLVNHKNLNDFINKPKKAYEEIMLEGFIISYIKEPFEEKLKRITKFIPKIDNWAVCDSFTLSLKMVKKHKEMMWEFIKPYFFSEHEFQVRFSIIAILGYFIEDKYLSDIFEVFNQIKNEAYYVKMAKAWAVSVCYVKYPEETFLYIKNNQLDDWTHNKAIQKIKESNRVDKDIKVLLINIKDKSIDILFPF